jgi:anaerobic magnesium-protoporphyrin IX monomethyl ester cyclase
MIKSSKNKVFSVTSNFENIPFVPKGEVNEDFSEKIYYPLGLAYLHSYLESKKIDVKTMCLNNKPYEYCFKKVIEGLKDFSPNIVGFQILTSNRVSSYRLIEYIHKNHPEIKIIIGGIHSTIMYKQLIEKYPFLIAILGEGEITFSELIKELNKNKPNLKKIDGLAYSKNNAVIRTKPRELIKNLDILPFPKHELFFKNNNKRYEGSLLTTRGCYFSCSFCSLNPESKRIVRFRSSKNVVDEIEYMIKSFPQMREIFIHDDSFFIDNQRVIDICDKIVKRNIKMNFVCSGRIKPLSKEMIKKLEQAGFKRVLLGIESGDNSILKNCHKGINQDDILNAFRLFSKSSINLKTFLIVGLPGENIETIKETSKFIKKIQKIKYFSSPNFSNLLVVYPGTEVYEIAKQKGMVDDSFWLSDKEIPIYTAENSYEKLKYLGNILSDNISFYRILTPGGFKAQFEMIPYLVSYLLKRMINIIKNREI